jgi:competence protein ComEC
LAAAERFLAAVGFDRAPWLAVAFGAGIAAWFALPSTGHWIALLAGCCGLAAASAAGLRPWGKYPYVRLAGIVVPLVVAAGCGSVWLRSSLAGADPIDRPMVAILEGTVLSVEPQPAQQRTRLVLATREPGTGRAIRVRLNLDDAKASKEPIRAGTLLQLRARLVPPAPPMLPGAYNFARSAWFGGLAATGSALTTPRLLRRGAGGAWLSELQHRITDHVRQRLAPEQSGIAAALTTGDMGGITQDDSQAMRDSGLAHLLSISGLHVSAVIGAVYLLAIRLLALSPWLALRVRLPVAAAGCGALAGVAYTLLSGSQVPTVRSCVGALLVLAALALGREALSLRTLALAAFLVLLLWPEAVIGPSFQMSFAAVLAIVALSGAGPIRRFLAPREEGPLARGGRHLAMILLTGVVIEAALMPIGLYHFHRGGIYGALANVLAIPLTTVVIMPAVLSGLVLDLIGIGAPAWWVAGKAVALLTGIAHWVAGRPGAVTMMPAFGGGAFVLFVAGGLWLGLWSGRVRWLGLAPALIGTVLVATVRSPDVLISGDGHHIGLLGQDGTALFVLRESRSDYARENLTEISGMQGDPVLITAWPGARCNSDACVVVLRRGDRDWRLLLTRSRSAVPERALAAACERVDLVISERWLPRSCHARWMKIDHGLLAQTGGMAIDLQTASITSVADGEGQHGWWRPDALAPSRRPGRPQPAAVDADSVPEPKSGPAQPIPGAATEPHLRAAQTAAVPTEP